MFEYNKLNKVCCSDCKTYRDKLVILRKINKMNLNWLTFQLVSEVVAFATGLYLTAGFIVPATLALLVVVVTVDS